MKKTVFLIISAFLFFICGISNNVPCSNFCTKPATVSVQAINNHFDINSIQNNQGKITVQNKNNDNNNLSSFIADVFFNNCFFQVDKITNFISFFNIFPKLTPSVIKIRAP